MSYEEALAELEQLSSKMSQGGLTLEESVATYQRGIELGSHCQKEAGFRTDCNHFFRLKRRCAFLVNNKKKYE